MARSLFILGYIEILKCFRHYVMSQEPSLLTFGDLWLKFAYQRCAIWIM